MSLGRHSHAGYCVQRVLLGVRGLEESLVKANGEHQDIPPPFCRPFHRRDRTVERKGGRVEPIHREGTTSVGYEGVMDRRASGDTNDVRDVDVRDSSSPEIEGCTRLELEQPGSGTQCAGRIYKSPDLRRVAGLPQLWSRTLSENKAAPGSQG